MDALGVQPDVGFFNQLIKRRASCGNTAAAKVQVSEKYRGSAGPSLQHSAVLGRAGGLFFGDLGESLLGILESTFFLTCVHLFRWAEYR